MLNEALQFSDLSLGSNFSIDESGIIAAYTTNNTIRFFDLTKNRPIESFSGNSVKGQLLVF